MRHSLLIVTILGAGAAACGGEPTGAETCSSPSPMSRTHPIASFDVRFAAGDEPLLLDRPIVWAEETVIRPTKARLFVSEVTLVAESGSELAAELVDARGERHPYELTLLDLERPEALVLNLRAPAGRYRALRLAVGVPPNCASGEVLNHADAAAMQAPLDVDSDMYWSWNAGYVFLKFEGQVLETTDWSGFFYHVGGPDRLARLELPGPIELKPEGGPSGTLIADFRRLLSSADSPHGPDVLRTEERRVHGGPLADALADNIRGSRFLRLER